MSHFESVRVRSCLGYWSLSAVVKAFTEMSWIYTRRPLRRRCMSGQDFSLCQQLDGLCERCRLCLSVLAREKLRVLRCSVWLWASCLRAWSNDIQRLRPSNDEALRPLVHIEDSWICRQLHDILRFSIFSQDPFDPARNFGAGLSSEAAKLFDL